MKHFIPELKVLLWNPYPPDVIVLVAPGVGGRSMRLRSGGKGVMGGSTSGGRGKGVEGRGGNVPNERGALGGMPIGGGGSGPNPPGGRGSGPSPGGGGSGPKPPGGGGSGILRIGDMCVPGSGENGGLST
jgi:hypothetical protein